MELAADNKADKPVAPTGTEVQLLQGVDNDKTEPDQPNKEFPPLITVPIEENQDSFKTCDKLGTSESPLNPNQGPGTNINLKIETSANHDSKSNDNQKSETSDGQEPRTSENQEPKSIDNQEFIISDNQEPIVIEVPSTSYNQVPGTSDNQQQSINNNQFLIMTGTDSDLDTSVGDCDLLQEIGSETVTLVNDSIVVEPEIKRRKVNIFIDDPKPRWYIAEGKNITKTIDPIKLVEAYSFLPVEGRPPSRSIMSDYQESKIKEFLGEGVDDSEFARLGDLCSPDNLLTGKELVMPSNVPNQGVWGMGLENKELRTAEEEEQGAHELCLVKKYKMRQEKDSGNTYSKKLKYRGVRIIPFAEEVRPAETLDSPLQPGKDLLYHVRLYRPFPHMVKEKSGPSRFRHSIFSYDVVLLGRQRLRELRDRIACANDVDMRLDMSDRYDEVPPTNAKDVFPSGFLFINNIFYVDTRAGCHDISAPLRRWAATKSRLGEFPQMDMNMRLDQVKIKLGHPEVYVHQGNCEHLFTFSEIRLLNASDPLMLSQYPVNTAISANQSMYCTTCAEFSAKWIVTECVRVPFDPAFFCDSCFRLYMFKDGKKIGNFKAFSYRGNELNMLKPQG